MSENKEQTTQQVAMTAEELAEWQQMKAEKAKREAEEQRKQQRAEYAEMVDGELAAAIPELRALSEQIRVVKDTVFGNFAAILNIKKEAGLMKADGQYSHTFTDTNSRLRITLGVNTVDGYRDTVEDGIAMVKQYIESLATDDKTKNLVDAVLHLLSRDNTGQLKASRVLQLEKMAVESGDDTFMEGVKIIKESYQPTTTGRYIRAQYRDESTNMAWRNIPLNITDVDLT